MIAAKRFWTGVSVVEAPGGFGLRLDERPLRTPAKAELVVPTLALGRAIAAEWAAIEGEVVPEALPFTRAANVALDRVAVDPAPVVDHVAAYGESDLLCYRADGPAGLVARQAAAWDPPLAWAAERLGAPLAPTIGVAHRAQDPASLAALRVAVAAHDPFGLTALHELVTLSGSLVLGLAVPWGRCPRRRPGRPRGSTRPGRKANGAWTPRPPPGRGRARPISSGRRGCSNCWRIDRESRPDPNHSLTMRASALDCLPRCLEALARIGPGSR